MDERRKFVRLSSRLNANYEIIGSGQTRHAMTGNVGGGGASLFTESRLAPGTLLRVEIAADDRPQPVRFTAEVVWSGALLLEDGDARPRAFETGVRFIDISETDRAFLLEAGRLRPPGARTAGSP